MPYRNRLARAAVGFCVSVASFAAAGAQVECGDSITSDTKLTADLECVSDGITIAVPGTTLDCAGHAIRGSGETAATGIRIAGERGVTVRNCTVSGFDTAVRLFDAPSFRLLGSRIDGEGTGIYAERSPRLRIERSSFEGHAFHLLVRNSPDVLVRASRFEPGESEGGTLSFNRSPRARILDNVSGDGAKVDLFAGSDASLVRGNDLGPAGEVAVFLASGVEISRNRVGRASSAGRDPGFAVRLTGADACRVRGNQLDGRGIFLMSFEGESPAGDSARQGSDGNRIEDNAIHGSAFGVYDFGGSGNRIARNRLDDVLLGVLLNPARADGVGLGFDCADNEVRGNEFDGGQLAIQSSDAANNLVVDNRIRRHDVGFLDLRTDLIGKPQNVFRGNVIDGSRIFGLVAYGSSPAIESNEFRDNGDESVPLPAEFTTLLASIADARGAVALLPFVGWQGGSFDDGDPQNDLLASPRIGGPRARNHFRGNAGLDIYALDTRPAAPDSLLADNVFEDRGQGLRFRQDWFGLIRVEDEDGLPVRGADVSVSDSLGVVVASFESGEGGFASADSDPDRPAGLLPIELGGPVPAWTRFTEYEFERSGSRLSLTPHRIAVRVDGRSGRACYSWDGLNNDRAGFHLATERYQTAVVRLSEADWTSCHASAASSRP